MLFGHQSWRRSEPIGNGKESRPKSIRPVGTMDIPQRLAQKLFRSRCLSAASWISNMTSFYLMMHAVLMPRQTFASVVVKCHGRQGAFRLCCMTKHAPYARVRRSSRHSTAAIQTFSFELVHAQHGLYYLCAQFASTSVVFTGVMLCEAPSHYIHVGLDLASTSVVPTGLMVCREGEDLLQGVDPGLSSCDSTVAALANRLPTAVTTC